MDTFFEQIIAIKKSGKEISLIILIWLAALLLSAAAFLFLGSFGLIIILGVGYGAWWLSSKFNVEYEYIVTNDTLDIDKITNKSSRKRISSISISKVERVEKFNPSLIQNAPKESLVLACNQNDENAFLMVSSNENSKVSYIVFAPNEKIQNAIKKSLPKFVGISAFKK